MCPRPYPPLAQCAKLRQRVQADQHLSQDLGLSRPVDERRWHIDNLDPYTRVLMTDGSDTGQCGAEACFHVAANQWIDETGTDQRQL
ncbi:hypothetical protein D3C80_1689840 [compost metagenome]